MQRWVTNPKKRKYNGKKPSKQIASLEKDDKNEQATHGYDYKMKGAAATRMEK